MVYVTLDDPSKCCSVVYVTLYDPNTCCSVVYVMQYDLSTCSSAVYVVVYGGSTTQRDAPFSCIYNSQCDFIQCSELTYK